MFGALMAKMDSWILLSGSLWIGEKLSRDTERRERRDFNGEGGKIC